MSVLGQTETDCVVPQAERDSFIGFELDRDSRSSLARQRQTD